MAYPQFDKRTGKVAVPPDIIYKNEKKRRLVLLIDNRERDDERNTIIADKMAAIGCQGKIKFCRLDLFDYVYAMEDNHDVHFGPGIELKTSEDLAASIKDGRYHSQIGRMNELGLPQHQKIYIHEGSLTDKHYNIDPKAMIGAVVKNAAKGQHEPHMTQNKNATADLIVHFFAYLEHVDDFQSIANYTRSDYAQGAVVKKTLNTDSLFDVFLVTNIVGISAPIAKAIVKTPCFSSLKKLQLELFKDMSRTRDRIAAISYESNGKNRKVGPAVAKKIAEFLDVSEIKKHVNDEDDIDDDDDDDDDDADYIIENKNSDANNLMKGTESQQLHEMYPLTQAFVNPDLERKSSEINNHDKDDNKNSKKRKSELTLHTPARKKIVYDDIEDDEEGFRRLLSNSKNQHNVLADFNPTSLIFKKPSFGVSDCDVQKNDMLGSANEDLYGLLTDKEIFDAINQL